MSPRHSLTCRWCLRSGKICCGKTGGDGEGRDWQVYGGRGEVRSEALSTAISEYQVRDGEREVGWESESA